MYVGVFVWRLRTFAFSIFILVSLTHMIGPKSPPAQYPVT